MTVITGTGSGDTLNGGADGDQISGLGGNDLINGNGGADLVEGGDGDDILRGGYDNNSNPPSGQTDGADTVRGGAGNDVIRGQDGDDLLYGEAGDDNLRGDLGNDLIDGGAGRDMVAYRFDDIGATVGVTLDASLIGTATTISFADGRGGTDTLTSIEGAIVVGTSFTDTLVGSAGGDQLSGGDGNDVINGGDGDDVIIDNNGSSTLTAGAGDDRFDMYGVGYTGAAGSGADAIDGGEGNDIARVFWGMRTEAITISLAGDGSINASIAGGGLSFTGTSIEQIQIFGGSGGDTITGGAMFDFLSGGGGADTLNGGGGNDELDGGAGDDILNGGDGHDYYLMRVANPFVGGTINASGVNVSGATTTVADGTGGTDTLTGIEAIALAGGHMDDTLIGSAGSDQLNGGYGGDIINGGDGDDLIVQSTFGVNFPVQPGVGQVTVTETVDQIDGGAGFDTVSYEGLTTALTLNLGSGLVSNSQTGADTIANVEAAIGGSANDSLTGNAGNNRLEGRSGNDFLQGQVGDDTLLGGAGDDVINGDGGVSTPVTGGNDYLDGGEGNDQLRGGAGLDEFHGGDGYDRVVFFMYNATQAVVADLRNQTISNDGFGNAETITSIEALGGGTRFADTFFGNDGNNLIQGSGGDHIEAFGGDDDVRVDAAAAMADGGSGRDSLGFFASRLIDSNNDGTAEVQNRTAGVVVDLGINRIVSDGFGTSGDILGFEDVWGTSFTDELTGSAGANLLMGLDGDDVLAGGAGADEMDGGNGSDTVSYATSGAAVAINLAAGAGSGGDALGDVLRSIENVIGSDHADTLVGSDDANVLTGGLGGDYLVGGGGADRFVWRTTAESSTSSAFDAVADFQTGQDQLDFANDTGPAFIVRSGSGSIVYFGQQPGGAFNGVVQVVGLIQGGDILTGGPGAYMYGENGVADDLQGSAGADVIAGFDGNDVIVGGDGQDALYGGSGSDRFVYNAASDSDFSGYDGIGDFTTASDQLDLTGLVGSGETNIALVRFGGSTFVYFGQDGAASFSGVILATGVVQGSDIILGSNIGLTLYGSAASEELVAGGGNDTVLAGDGADVIVGGNGADSLFGGAGADVFDYNTASHSTGAAYDTIQDFQVGIDKIDLRGVASSATLTSFGGATFVNFGANGQIIVAGVTLTQDDILVTGESAPGLDAKDEGALTVPPLGDEDPLILPVGFEGKAEAVIDHLDPLILPRGFEGKIGEDHAPEICPPGDGFGTGAVSPHSFDDTLRLSLIEDIRTGLHVGQAGGWSWAL